MQNNFNYTIKNPEIIVKDLENKISQVMTDYKDNLESYYYDGLDRIQSIFDEKVNKIMELNQKFEFIRLKHEHDDFLSK